MALGVDLGHRVRDMRIARGMSQAELARQLDVSAAAVWNWEMNGVQPRPAMLARVAGALGTSEDYLLTGAADEAGAARTSAGIIHQAKKAIAALNGVEPDRVLIKWRVQS